MKHITCLLIIYLCFLTLSFQQAAQGTATKSNQNPGREERLKEIQRRRKQLQQKYAQEENLGQKDQVHVYEDDGEITKTQKKKNQQRQAMMQHEQSANDVSTKEYLFETQKSMDEFVMNIPHQQQVFMLVKIYVSEDNVYGEIQDVEKEPPLRIYVYENNNRIIVQKEFYFQGIISFTAKKDSTYTIRYYNTGKQKLISVYQNRVIENSNVENLLSGDDAKKHVEKTKFLVSELDLVLRNIRRTGSLSIRNASKFNSSINYFLFYQVIELLICLAVCFTQISFIKKLLKGTSII